MGNREITRWGQAGRASRKWAKGCFWGELDAPGSRWLDQGASIDVDGGGDGGEIAFISIGGVAKDVDASGDREVEAHGGIIPREGYPLYGEPLIHCCGSWGSIPLNFSQSAAHLSSGRRCNTPNPFELEAGCSIAVLKARLERSVKAAAGPAIEQGRMGICYGEAIKLRIAIVWWSEVNVLVFSSII